MCPTCIFSVFILEKVFSVFRQSLLEVKSDPHGLQYRFTPETPLTTSEALRDYLQLEVSMSDLFQQWISVDPSLQAAANAKAGMRILRQDPWECTVSFLCSQNNNIKRITKMLQTLRAKFGQPVTTKYDRDWFAFPTPEELATASLTDLREIGLGYRAEYVFNTCKTVLEKGGSTWLLNLRGDLTAPKQLRELSGIGPKVADCITLFALDGKGVVPIDVHMWRIAKIKFPKELRGFSSLFEAAYQRTEDLFQNKYGEYAGWAHSYILFRLLYAASISAPVTKRKRSPDTAASKRTKLSSN